MAGAADIFYEELKQIICSVLQQGLSGRSLIKALNANVSITGIYASDDMLVTNSYFSLLHYATGEEMVTDAEWEYFFKVLVNKCVGNAYEAFLLDTSFDILWLSSTQRITI